jgi:hypothetical protein
LGLGLGVIVQGVIVAMKMFCISLVILMPVVMFMAMVMFMPVVPQLGFVEQEEKQQAKQQRDEQVVGFNASFKGFGQEVQKCCGQQSASGQTEHVLSVSA